MRDLQAHWTNAICNAFALIEDKNALAWSVIDTKSEGAVVRSLALQINRASSMSARVEYPPRIDLVVIEETVPIAAFEAKAAYLTDFQPKYIAKRNWYLGPCVNSDIEKLISLRTRLPSLQYFAAIFFIYEVDGTDKQLKYRGRPPVQLAQAEAALKSAVYSGNFISTTFIDCGQAHGANVKIHMYLFEPRFDLDKKTGNPNTDGS